MHLLVDVCLPPLGLALLALALLLLGGRRAHRLATLAVALLVLLGMPPVADALLDSLAPPKPASGPTPAAIVILSADGVRIAGLPDLAPGLLTLDRLSAGAALERATKLPVLVSGGPILGSTTSLAEMIQISLQTDFAVPVRWVEGRSTDTWQNAEFSAAILKREGISRIYLVTHFWHERRALLAFRAFGIDPVSAPVRPPAAVPFRWTDLLPRVSAWNEAYLAFHEWIGFAFYSLR